MWGSLISAGASLAGGLLNRSAAQDAQQQTRENLDRQMQMQKDFAKSGIRWRVEDARKAGIHPLYALGANTPQYTPSSATFAADNSLGNSFAAAGQDIGRAINSTRTGAERESAFTRSMQNLQLQNAGLDLEIKKATLASAVQRNIANRTPPGPGIASDSFDPFKVPEASKSEDRPPLMLGGVRVRTPPTTSPMKAWEDQFGDDGPGSWLPQIAVLGHTYGHNMFEYGRRFIRGARSGGSGW